MTHDAGSTVASPTSDATEISVAELTGGEPRRGLTIAALAAVYLIWGSTYLAIRIALEGYPPFLLSAMRFLLAGGGMWVLLLVRGAPRPTRRQWVHGSLVGLLLPAIGVGGVVWAERTVTSGVTAVFVAGVSLWTALFQGLFGHWPSRRQWAGILLGFSGVVVLCMGDDLRASPLGIALLLGSGIVWAFGSALSRRLDLPKGLMAPTVEMLAAGVILSIVGIASQETLGGALEVRPTLAVAYLAVAGGIAYSAYSYLLGAVTPAVATSYCYVNPVVALVLGAWLGAEKFTIGTFAALPVILAGVALVLTGGLSVPADKRRSSSRKRAETLSTNPHPPSQRCPGCPPAGPTETGGPTGAGDGSLGQRSSS